MDRRVSAQRPRVINVDTDDAEVADYRPLAGLGLQALRGFDLDSLLEEATAIAAAMVGAPMASVQEALPDGWRVRAAAGWAEELVGSTVPAVKGSATLYTLMSAEPVVFSELDNDGRFSRSPLLAGQGVHSGVAVVVMATDRPFGILGVYWDYPRKFTESDVAVVQLVANVIGAAIQRQRSDEASRLALLREQQATDRLRSLDEMKSTFLEAISHELRTPLASVLGFALTLERQIDALEREETKMLLARLAVNARRLDDLLKDLLDLDRLYRRTVKLTRRPTNLLKLVTSAAEAADLSGFSVHISGEPVTLAVDAPKVTRIVENLLSNSVKHARGGSNIWIRVTRTRNGATITVEDDGPGIPESMMAAIFDTFRRGRPTQSHVAGSGIGLSLVQRFAELHGGRAWAANRIGGGAAFRVYLPGG